jgi:hypothetical protein
MILEHSKLLGHSIQNCLKLSSIDKNEGLTKAPKKAQPVTHNNKNPSKLDLADKQPAVILDSKPQEDLLNTEGSPIDHATPLINVVPDGEVVVHHSEQQLLSEQSIQLNDPALERISKNNLDAPLNTVPLTNSFLPFE